MTEDNMAAEIRKAKRFNDIAFIITIIFAAALIFLLCRMYRYTTFSPQRWKEDHAHRSYMLSSLLKQHKLYNMGKDEIIELLGYDQHKWNISNDNYLTYYMGKSAVTEADKWLILEMKSNRVTGYRIYTE